MEGVGKRFAMGWVMESFRLEPRNVVAGNIVDGAPPAKHAAGRARRAKWPALNRQRSGFFKSEKRSGSRPIDGCSIGASTVRAAVRSLAPGSLGPSRCEVAPRQRSSTAPTKCISWPAGTDGTGEIVAFAEGG